MTREELEGYDVFVTSLPDVAIGVRTADYVPVLLYDPVKRVVAAAHAGWKGTVLHISEKTVELMAAKYGCNASDIRVVLGPSIGPDSFQVGEEVAEYFKNAQFPMDEIWSFRGQGDGTPMSGGHHIDLWKANCWLLEQAGVKPENIQVGANCSAHCQRFCPACNFGVVEPKRYYRHTSQGNKGDSGD